MNIINLLLTVLSFIFKLSVAILLSSGTDKDEPTTGEHSFTHNPDGSYAVDENDPSKGRFIS